MKKHPYINEDLKAVSKYALIITLAAMIILFVVAGLLT